jgi:hypothetical protein
MLSQIELLCTDHEVMIKQTIEEENEYILLPKVTAVNIAREIIKRYPKDAINAIFEELNEKK